MSRVPAAHTHFMDDETRAHITALGDRQVSRMLHSALRPTLVRYISGNPADGCGAELRRRKALIYWNSIAEAEGGGVALLWFTGANPWLGDDTPLTAIREDRFAEVETAVRALVDDSFSG